MNKYEVMYIVRPDMSEDDRKVLVENFGKIFTDRQGTVSFVEGWGMRDLAYDIEKHSKGFYVLMNVESNVEAVTEFERLARISEDIIRFLVVKAQEA
ncbi:MAG: 30S ribosomal protein S6 [Culicoidibacterales bacterium]